MMAITWKKRPIEQIRLLNPAFLTILTWSCVKEYQKQTSQGFPYILVFLLIAIILHKPTREKLPRSTTTSLSAWLIKNPEVNLGFSERVISLKPFVKESILYSVNSEVIEVSAAKLLILNRPRSLTAFLSEASNEVKDCIRKAKFIGKWFALSGETTTILSLWGVKP